MIVSASRRTDLPARYAPWLARRVEEGFVWVRNPMNPRRVSRVSLLPDVVDAMVLWTKNPLPLFPYWSALDRLPHMVQFTLTPYGADVEPGLPDKRALLDAFCALARRLGPGRVVWRYDPIALHPTYTVDFHLRAFRAMAERLRGCTDQCTVSFLDSYRCTARAEQALALRAPGQDEILRLMQGMAPVARSCGMALATCAERIDLSALGVTHARCIDPDRLERITGWQLDLPRDRSQRPACGCAASVDIGAYNTCLNGCAYCYANHSADAIRRNAAQHDPASPLLFGSLEPLDVLTDRPAASCRMGQTRLF